MVDGVSLHITKPEVQLYMWSGPTTVMKTCRQTKLQTPLSSTGTSRRPPSGRRENSAYEIDAFSRERKLWAIKPVKPKRTKHNTLWSNHGPLVVRPGASKLGTNAQQLPLLTGPPNSSLLG